MRELKSRTKQFALEVIRFVDQLPRNPVCSHIARQLLRAGTSVAANYRAACRGRSEAELYSKLCICEEEADETLFWVELLVESGQATPGSAKLMDEANQLVAIFVAAKKKLKSSAVRENRAAYLNTPNVNPDLSEFDLRPSTFDLVENA